MFYSVFFVHNFNTSLTSKLFIYTYFKYKSTVMNKQFCRVGRIKPNVSKTISLKDLEKKPSDFVDDMGKIDFSEGTI